MGKTYVHAVASLDGYIADERDHVEPLHDWYFNGDHPLVDEDPDYVHGSPFRVSPDGPSNTTLTLSYDWSAVSDAVREHIGFPPFPPEHLRNTLAHLTELVTR